MKFSRNQIVCQSTARIIVLQLILLLVISLVSCRRQKPQRDEIERVFNETYSIIWKCSVAECPPGMGLSVPCGTSVRYSASIECVDCVNGANSSATRDYSQCKSCMKCSANEKTSGHCTTSEDTTKCLKACHKGFYWDNVTDSCNSCSDCCGENLKHHEEQCEKSGLLISHQCRQSHVVCQRPTTGRRERPGTKIPTANTTKDYPTGDPSPNDDRNVVPNDDPKQRSLSSSKIAGIIVGCILFAIIVLGVIIWKFCGWQHAKTIFKNCWCYNQGHSKVTFNLSYDAEGNDSESAPCLNKSHSEEVEKKGFLISGLPAVKRPGHHRVFSVPVEFNDAPKAKMNLHRSHSHPGCHKDLNKDAKDNKPGSPKKCPHGWSLTKKFGKKGEYFLVPMNPELPDDVIVQNPGAEREEKPRNLGPPTVNVAKDQCTSTTGLDHHISTINPASEFQHRLLSKRMATVPIQHYRKICNKLDVLREFWDDYRMFGEKIGLNRDEILLLGQSGKPTDSMIMQKFDSQRDSSIGKFKEIMEEMERDDVVTVIKEWVLYEWEKSNNV